MTRSEYAIRLHCGALYLRDNGRLVTPEWTLDERQAYRFAQQTTALLFASEWLMLDPTAFAVVPVERRGR